MRTLSPMKCIFVIIATSVFCSVRSAMAQYNGPLPIAIVGLRDGKVAASLKEIAAHSDVKLVGIVEPNKAALAKYNSQSSLDGVPIFSTINELIEKQHPAALLLYTAQSDYRRIIQDASAYGVSVVVERPIATSLDEVLAIRHFVHMHRGVQVLINYETSWYASNHDAIEEANHGAFGDIRGIVVHNAAPQRQQTTAGDGTGNLYSSGLYAAALVTVLMHGKTPVSVTSQARTVKPDGQLTMDGGPGLIVRYAEAQVFLQTSGNSPSKFTNIEIYGSKGYAITVDKEKVRVKYAGQEAGQDKESAITTSALSSPDDDSLHYLEAAIAGKVDAEHSLGGIETTVIAMQILNAARESATTGKSVTLHPLPAD